MNDHLSPSSQLPRYPQSGWIDTAKLPDFPGLHEDIQCDVSIVGAGITGITTAYLLTKSGYKVALLDSGDILGGTTGHTTAKVTSQHGMIYDKLIRHFGEEEARLYYEANEEALAFVRNTVKDLKIECDLKQEQAYLYADSEDQEKQLRKEWDAYQKLGIPGEWIDSLPIPVEARGAIVMKDQAQFHPLQYLRGLTNYITSHGGLIYEKTTIENSADDTEDGRKKIVTVDGHTVTCRYVLSASHYPFLDGGGFYFTRLHAERSYVVAIEPEVPYEGGMYINCGSPKRSLRSARLDGKDVILVGGESHKTGQGECTFRHYEELEQFAGMTFGIKSIPYRWSTQDLVTLDEVPYIGHLTSDSPNVYVATGYYKWGMTSGTLAGLIIHDLILGQENRYAELYTPSRFKPNPSVKNFIVQNADVAGELISGKVELNLGKAADLKADEGAPVRHMGRRAGAYKDPDGKLYLVDTTCTHMGCEVEWNAAERSWDCPCHGSRFDYKGNVIEGPATENLPLLSSQPGQGEEPLE